MGESTKAVAVLVLIFAALLAAAAWSEDRPGELTWAARIGGTVVVVLALGTILTLHFRKDIEHDYLREHAPNYFNRNGFCFAFNAQKTDGVAYLQVLFQNQFDRPSFGHIIVKPAKGFWLRRPKFEALTCQIKCEPAAFGVARIPMPVPEEHQGKRQSFEVVAGVQYPDGKGNRIRFFDGISIPGRSSFGTAARTAATVIGAAGGSISLSKPATVTVELPQQVADEIPDMMPTEVVTIWKLDEPTSTDSERR